MRVFVVDAFTENLFEGNQAGVILLENNKDFISEELMQKISAELKHSETAFISRAGERTFSIRYFTPVSEVPFCGHATIAAFSVLKQENIIGNGSFRLLYTSGTLKIDIMNNYVWIESASPSIVKAIEEADSNALYEAYGLSKSDHHHLLRPMAINAGLTDILLPVSSKKSLMRASQNRQEVIRLSERHKVVGIHMFALSNEEGVTAYCSNFAPLYGIDEECATGTSNAALTFYLYTYGLLEKGKENLFVQGEHMARRTEIKSIILDINGKIEIAIGGSAVISMELFLRL